MSPGFQVTAYNPFYLWKLTAICCLCGWKWIFKRFKLPFWQYFFYVYLGVLIENQCLFSIVSFLLHSNIHCQGWIFLCYDHALLTYCVLCSKLWLFHMTNLIIVYGLELHLHQCHILYEKFSPLYLMCRGNCWSSPLHNFFHCK